jgi:hypothetical protein
VQFKIDDDVFHGVPNLPATALVEFASVAETIDADSNVPEISVFTKMFEILLTPTSAERFIERMSSPTEPISLAQIQDILPWIMEEFGMRPTSPSPDSSAGSESPGDGTRSTGSALAVVSTLNPSPPTGS